MKFPSVLDDSKEAMGILVEKVMDRSSPTIAVYTYSFFAGLSKAMGWITDALPTLCMLAGFIGAVVLAQLNYKKKQREEVEKRTAEINEEIAKLRLREIREELREMGVETRKGDLK